MGLIPAAMQEGAASGPATRNDKTPSSKKSEGVSEASNLSESTIGIPSLSEQDEGSKPSLLPRRATLELIGSAKTQRSPTDSLRVPKKASRPSLQATATTAISFADVETQLHSDGSQRTPARSLRSISSRPSLRSLRLDPPYRHRSRTPSEAGETASIHSLAPTVGAGADVESILGDLLLTDQRSPGWKFLNEPTEKELEIPSVPFDTGEPTAEFNREFDEIPEIAADGSNEGMLGTWASGMTELRCCRCASRHVEIKAEALLDSFCRRKAHI